MNEVNASITIVPTSISALPHQGYLAEIGGYGTDFPYMQSVEASKADAEAWLLRHCNRFSQANIVFAMPDKTLCSFSR